MLYLVVLRNISDVVDGGCSVLQFTAVTAGQDLPPEDRGGNPTSNTTETRRSPDWCICWYEC